MNLKLKSGVLAEPILVGREKELEEMHRCLDSATEGKGNTVFVSGEAGSGKTRLLNEFISAAKQKKKVITLTGGCLSNAAVPYSPFLEAFNSYFSQKQDEHSQHDELEIYAWLTGAKQTEKSDGYGILAPQAWRDLTFAAVTKALSVISSEKPVILLIEDLHWADSASLALLHYVARVLQRERVLLLATFRSEELTTDEEGHGHPLAEELRLMRRERLLKEINLTNLDQVYVTKVAENMMGGAVSAELSAKLAEESRGNALFVVESLRMLFERGSLHEEDGQWRLSVDTLGIPDRFKDIILRRLSVLKFNQRRVIDAASVIGERFDFELLSVVLGQDSLEVLEALNAVAKSTSLIRVEESFFRFDHAKSREAIYEEIALPLKRGYHRRVAEKLESASQDGKMAFSEIAYHYAEAGNTEKAVKYALEAGKEASARFSNAEAIKHFAYVVQTVPDAPESAGVRSTALEGLGDAYYANCMFEKAIETFEELASSETGIVKLRAHRKEMEAIFYKKEPLRLMELVKKAEKYAASDRLENARVRWNRGRAFLYLGDLKRALEDHEEALRVFEEEYSLHDAANLAIGTGATRFQLNLSDLFEKGLSEVLRGTALFHELGDARMEVMGFGQAVAFQFYSLGLFQEALGSLANAIQIGERIGDFDNVAIAVSRVGEILEISGNWAEALSQYLKALEYSQKTDAKMTETMIYANLTAHCALRGDLNRAEEYYGKLMKMPKEIISGWRIAFYVELAETVLFAAKSQWKEANLRFDKWFEYFKSLSPRTWFALEISVRRSYAWALEKQGRAEEARVQLTEAQRLFGEAEKRFAHANIQANLMMKRRVEVGEHFEMRLDLVNVARNPGSIIKIESVTPSDGFKVDGLTSGCSLQNGGIELKERSIGPFQVRTIKLALQASKTGTYTLNPQVFYMDDLGENKTYKLNPLAITVQPAQQTVHVLPDRVSSGYDDLDDLLAGGIPENYAIVLASPSCNEKELLVKRFLEAGATAGETTFHITAEAASTKALAEKYSSNFYLFLCNPQADAIVQNQPNVFKLKGIENLTDIDIALTKAFRTLNPTGKGTKRICIDIVSDILLQHHAINTRRWLSALLPTLKSKGFTILAVVDPQMHPPEETQAVLGLFDGEIAIYEKETPKGTERFLKIRRLSNQKYLKDETLLAEE